MKKHCRKAGRFCTNKLVVCSALVVLGILGSSFYEYVEGATITFDEEGLEDGDNIRNYYNDQTYNYGVQFTVDAGSEGINNARVLEDIHDEDPPSPSHAYSPDKVVGARYKIGGGTQYFYFPYLSHIGDSLHPTGLATFPTPQYNYVVLYGVGYAFTEARDGPGESRFHIDVLLDVPDVGEIWVTPTYDASLESYLVGSTESGYPIHMVEFYVPDLHDLVGYDWDNALIKQIKFGATFDQVWEDHTYFDNFTFEFRSPVSAPAPSSVVLLGIGLVAFTGIGIRRRKRKK
jgi:hypothetical protein